MDYPPYSDIFRPYDLDVYGSGCYFPYSQSNTLYPAHFPRTYYDDAYLYRSPKFSRRYADYDARDDLPRRRNYHDCSSSSCQKMKIENSCNCSWKHKKYPRECCNHHRPKCCYPQCYNSLLQKFLLSPYIQEKPKKSRVKKEDKENKENSPQSKITITTPTKTQNQPIFIQKKPEIVPITYSQPENVRYVQQQPQYIQQPQYVQQPQYIQPKQKYVQPQPQVNYRPSQFKPPQRISTIQNPQQNYQRNPSFEGSPRFSTNSPNIIAPPRQSVIKVEPRESARSEIPKFDNLVETPVNNFFKPPSFDQYKDITSSNRNGNEDSQVSIYTNTMGREKVTENVRRSSGKKLTLTQNSN